MFSDHRRLLPGIASIAALVLAAGCGAGMGRATSELSPDCGAEITAYGSRASLRENPTSPAVALAAVATPPTAIGYGPGAGYREELTLVDGVWRIARATAPDAVIVEAIPASDAAAVFLVTAAPARWRTRHIDTPVNGFTDLEARLLAISRASPCPSAAIPFRLTGEIVDADWSVVGRPEGARGRIAAGRVTIVGVFDPLDADRYFMPVGQRLHAHIVTETGDIAAHLASFSLLRDGALSVPRR